MFKSERRDVIFTKSRIYDRLIRSLLVVAFLLTSVTLLAIIPYNKVEASNPMNSIVGAIRWDAWTGDNPDIVGDVGEEMNESLGLAKYHYRLPFYAQVTGSDSVNVNAATQTIMDQEIAYAKNSGIDYWAFHYYNGTGNETGMQLARELYLSSAYKNDVKFCISVETGRLTSEAIDLFVTYFQMSNYQTVLNGRPLFYIFNADLATSSKISELRSDASAAGVGDPYIVFMNMGGSVPAGIDAHTRYATPGSNGIEYASLASSERSLWDNYKNSGKKVIPWVTTGWDKRPRFDNPVFWETVSENAWVQHPSPSDIAGQLQAALNWNYDNQSAAEANAVLIYAWNEFDEGGWLCPSLYYGADRLNTIANVLGGTQQAISNPPASGTNLALGKTSSASTTYGTNYASYAVDGNVDTAWSASGQTSGAWLEVNFGLATTFNKTILKTNTYNRITGYKMQYYDGSSWIDIATDKWSTPYTPMTFNSVTASRIRVYITAAASNPIIHEFEVYNSIKAWEYNSTTEGWTSYYQVSGFGWQSEGYIDGTNNGSDPQIRSSDNLNVDLSNARYIIIRYKNNSSSTIGKFYFITNSDTSWNETKAKSFTVNANDSTYTEYVIDMSSVSGWTGILKQLRFDPNTDSSGSFSVDYIRITQ